MSNRAKTSTPVVPNLPHVIGCLGLRELLRRRPIPGVETPG